MLARSDNGGRATVHNARSARRFRAVSYEHATSLELVCFIGVTQRQSTLNETFVPQESNGCDHTSTNTPYPIRTPQLSVLG